MYVVGEISRVNLISKEAEARYFLSLCTLASSFVHTVVVLIWLRAADTGMRIVPCCRKIYIS